MNTINCCVLEGKVAKYGGGGEFTLEVVRNYKKADGTYSEEKSLIDCECHGFLAEIADNHCKVGRGVRVVGRLGHRGGKENLVLVCEKIEFKAFKEV